MEEFKAAWESASHVQYVIGDGHGYGFGLMLGVGLSSAFNSAITESILFSNEEGCFCLFLLGDIQ